MRSIAQMNVRRKFGEHRSNLTVARGAANTSPKFLMESVLHNKKQKADCVTQLTVSLMICKSLNMESVVEAKAG